MKNCLLGLAVFLSIFLVGCSSEPKNTESELDKIQLGDSVSDLKEKYGEPDNRLTRNEAQQKIASFQRVIRDGKEMVQKYEPEELDGLTEETLNRALNVSEDAYQDKFLELWEYNYKNEDDEDDTFSIFVNHDEVIYLPPLYHYE